MLINEFSVCALRDGTYLNKNLSENRTGLYGIEHLHMLKFKMELKCTGKNRNEKSMIYHCATAELAK